MTNKITIDNNEIMLFALNNRQALPVERLRAVQESVCYNPPSSDRIKPSRPTSHTNTLQERPIKTDTACSRQVVTQYVTTPTRQADYIAHRCSDDLPEIFTKVKKLGFGSYGTVYLAYMRGEDDKAVHVALKEFVNRVNDPDAAREEILQELTVASKLRHPNIMNYFIGFETTRNVYGVMEAITGVNAYAVGSSTPQYPKINELRDVEKRLRAAPIIAYKLMDALAYMHAHGVVHRDLKGDNVMITDSLDPKIIDFGFGCVNECQMDYGAVDFTYRTGFVERDDLLSMDAYKVNDVYAMSLTIRDFIMTCYQPLPDSMIGLKLWQGNSMGKFLSEETLKNIRKDFREAMGTRLLSTGATNVITTNIMELILEGMGTKRPLAEQRNVNSLVGLPTAEKMRDMYGVIAKALGYNVPDPVLIQVDAYGVSPFESEDIAEPMIF